MYAMIKNSNYDDASAANIAIQRALSMAARPADSEGAATVEILEALEALEITLYEELNADGQYEREANGASARAIEEAETAVLFAVEHDDEEEPTPPPCECDCGCDEPSTTTDHASGQRLCAACADYTVLDDGTVVCSRDTEDGTTCPQCGQGLDWGPITTGSPGDPNYCEATCPCGTWRDEDRGGFGHLRLVPRDEA